MQLKPIIGITMGDPASIGPEIALKALINKELYEECRPLLVGDLVVFEHIKNLLNLNISLNRIENVNEAKFEYGTVDVFDLGNTDIANLKFGEISANAGN